MNRVWRDVIGAIIVAGLIFAYLGLVLNDTVGRLGSVTILGNPPIAQGPQGMAVIGVIAAVVLLALLGLGLANRRPWLGAGIAVGVIGLGITAAVTADWIVLAVFMGAVVLMWLLFTARDVSSEVVAHGNRPRSVHA